jgi:Protein of unknown function (DUF2971)
VNEPTIDFEALVDSYLEPATNSLMSMWYPSQFRPPARIHHYTTASSLQSIIEHHELWATDARYLNDSRELVHAEELIATALREAESRISNEWASRFIGEAILHSKPLLIFGEPLDIFVVSFCSDNDLLSQWRGYSGSTGGYSIALDSRVLASLRHQDLSLRHVIYRTDKQEQYIRAVVDGYESALAQIAEERDESELEECIGPFAQRFWAAIFETFFCFKHSAFEEEKEWRLVYPRFRIRTTHMSCPMHARLEER